MRSLNAEELGEQLARSRKYRDILPSTLARIAAEGLRRHDRQREALDWSRRKLHEIYGAFAPESDLRKLELELESVEDGRLPDFCRKLLTAQVSTRERGEAIAERYARIFAETGLPTRVLDLGSGFAPAALPWMGLSMETYYEAWDLNLRSARLLDQLRARLRQPGIILARDVLSDPPTDTYDVVLLQKLLPTLERQQAGFSEILIKSLRTKFAVVTFATQTLGARRKGFVEHHAAWFSSVIPQARLLTTTHDEQIFVIAID